MVRVQSPVTGTIFKLLIGVGESVNQGDSILVIESMKMEIPLESPCAGSLQALLVVEGDHVEEGQVLADVAPT
jgi:acetyl-CoA carboxylase biotin carboxyl carrier protein